MLGCGDDEGSGMSQKRSGLEGTLGMSPLHSVPTSCPHGPLNLLAPSLEPLKDVIFTQGKGGSFASMSSSVKEVNGSIASLNSLMHTTSWCGLSV